MSPGPSGSVYAGVLAPAGGLVRGAAQPAAALAASLIGGPGAVFIYERHSVTGLWTQRARLTSPLPVNATADLRLAADELTPNSFGRFVVSRSFLIFHQQGGAVYGQQCIGRANIDALGNRSRSGFDTQGRVIEKEDALGRLTAYSYDSNGDLVRVVDSNTNTTEFDSRGNIVQRRAPLDRTTSPRELRPHVPRRVADVGHVSRVLRGVAPGPHSLFGERRAGR